MIIFTIQNIQIQNIKIMVLSQPTWFDHWPHNGLVLARNRIA